MFTAAAMSIVPALVELFPCYSKMLPCCAAFHPDHVTHEYSELYLFLYQLSVREKVEMNHFTGISKGLRHNT